jgi:hypothetical protein
MKQQVRVVSVVRGKNIKLFVNIRAIRGKKMENLYG